MIDVQLSHLADVLDATLVGDDVTIRTVSTDTRHIEHDGLFIALKGERFDAHDFCDQALENGARALLVSRQLPLAVPQLVVADTRIALGQIGAWVAKTLTETHGLKTVALTGSCGKTTVKEMVAAILEARGKVLATAGNFNNDIGVPLTLLRLTAEHDFAVIELGANHQNEIAYTTNLVKPQAALINNLAAAHLEGFGSLEGVAKAKGEIFEGLPAGGMAVVNLDSHDLSRWSAQLTEQQVVTFSAPQSEADFSASDININSDGRACFTMRTPKGDIPVQLTLAGSHNVANALAAAALSFAMGASLADVAQGLGQVSNVKGRVDITQPYPGLRLIDDTYNASVASVKAAIDLLASFTGLRWFVLGDMAELGEESEQLHREVAEYAMDKGFDAVFTFGKASAVVSELNQGQHFAEKSGLLAAINAQVAQVLKQHQEVTVLAKGARSSRMEDVIAALQENK
ncbi:UDP-N-acetylmuramoyl-tripeptide--D-alanyl-D-alanine ligase [Photobacterium jeanii]|uniref:UDP-N-acetylmuramoyl-tripeptide--D-alanyl-D-alanine ligase n=1 Tax=Photobacterium jeanii TaxID=858640 RepID=A0A178KH06_9GAMM|nr:UDP-N-acetylmuramoyl-tripeptide--D-alanyl-D-alanine ligase [Photobacterium jeanii]OAN16568.1 UDP-N-acetylmuramoyl-tripeptide--D-alanyl-D-alanine ligase [Photobacterium jeanii]PST87961.1 UDP-N-acetylmuramoyl-tripeptide--D-alanyl-D-alanine ligase [Photobacterium jeanii]